ncbi:hypothetical protein CYY_009319 [Polysphondylium violaceum]|uniref:Phospholipid-transporting ATPase n=1 Tax=Polysphondylium violaceum TaxID=133409 RepID=A0A8J4PM14_9MYCE|nr:hypothetical protein CYY_009319 [Polysphondylium violaceum]
MMDKLFKSSNTKHHNNTIRTIYAGDVDRNRAEYPNNRISNTKYTALSFLPKNMIEQFGRAMNIYFLFIGVLQLFPALTPVNPLSTWGGLLFIFSISAIKEAFDDIGRRRRDKLANERVYTVVRDGKKQSILSESILVGDIVYLENNSEIPCDLLLLSTSETENNSCFIQTANLDGETDLKTRYSIRETSKLSEQRLMSFNGVLECPSPNPDIYRFDSRLSMKVNSKVNTFSHSDWLTVDASNLVLQATHLRNTDYIYGLAVYTGNQTKLGMNKMSPPTKWTKLDRAVNQITVFVFVFQLIMVLIFGLIGDLFTYQLDKKAWYLPPNAGMFKSIVVVPLRFLLLNSMMIPISLKVTMDVTKYTYALFINWDLKMYHRASDSPATANSTALSEDLGQLEYIFTDKTGTLTENIMLFSKCSINGVVYGANSNSGNSNNDDGDDDGNIQLLSPSSSQTALEDPNLLGKLASKSIYEIEFFKALALCHTVVIGQPHHNEQQQEQGEDQVMNNYKASSPDEEALVKASFKLGIKFINRTPSQLTINVMNDSVDSTYQLLHTFDFTSDRKRMSVVLLDERNGVIKIITKGADEVVFQKLDQSNSNNHLLDTYRSQIDEFAHYGLRTLCVAQKEINEQDYRYWFEKYYQKANTAIEGRSSLLSEAYDMLERNLELLGITAIEDKLQESVPQTIHCMREANIKVWMLTGDKYSTAIQIAHSCNLIDDNGKLYTVGKALHDQSNAGAHPAISQKDVEMSIEALYKEIRSLPKNTQEISSIIIEGHVLALALIYAADNLLAVSQLVGSLICCRVTPNQKAQVVKMIKDTGRITAAIGDGGNDVSMIQEANIGIGISGREGLQASRAADYSIARFKYLQELVLVHGRYSYVRSSFVANYSFYKSLFMCFIQILYQLFCGYAGTSFFNTFSLTSYNILFTGLPVIGFVLDKDLPEAIIRRNPILYTYTQEGRLFNRRVFAGWFIRALFQAIFVFCITVGAFAYGSGSTIDYNSVSMISFTGIIFIQSLTLYFESHTITWINHILLWGTIPLYFFCVFFLNSVPTMDTYSVMTHLFDSSSFYFSLVLMVFACIIPVLIIQYIFVLYKPTISEIIHQVRLTSFSGSDSNSNNSNNNGQKRYSSISDEETSAFSNMIDDKDLLNSSGSNNHSNRNSIENPLLGNINERSRIIQYKYKKHQNGNKDGSDNSNSNKNQKNQSDSSSFQKNTKFNTRKVYYEKMVHLVVGPREEEEYENKKLYDQEYNDIDNDNNNKSNSRQAPNSKSNENLPLLSK